MFNRFRGGGNDPLTRQAQTHEQTNNFSADEREVLRAVELHGGITEEMTNRHGWTRQGAPLGPLRSLVQKRVIAPRVLTSQPLRIVWQMRTLAHAKHNDAKIQSEASRLRLKEHARGGFQLTLRKELRR